MFGQGNTENAAQTAVTTEGSKGYIDTELGKADTFSGSSDECINNAYNHAVKGNIELANAWGITAQTYLARAAVHQKNAELELKRIELGLATY